MPNDEVAAERASWRVLCWTGRRQVKPVVWHYDEEQTARRHYMRLRASACYRLLLLKRVSDGAIVERAEG